MHDFNNKKTRIIVSDSQFGEMSYHKKFNRNNDFPGHKFLCDHPFNYVEIRRHGGVNICCPQWNPAEIGNVFKQSLEDIWSSDRAQIIRDSITNGDYSYCNNSTCPRIQEWKIGGLTPNTPENLSELLEKVSRTPNHVHLVLDHSCNLACPSCRTSKITQLEKSEQDLGLQAARLVFNSMFSHPHDEHKVIGMDGSGEIFSSNVYKTLFETEDIFTKTHQWPNLRFSLSTNGTMMTEKIQKNYNYLFDHLSRIEISIDAGNKESYEKVRVGGHWDLLWKNIDYFYSTIKDKKEVTWIWNIIIQKDNFESIPEFIKLSKKYIEHKPELNFAKVLNWGTWSDEEYLNRAVHLPSHPLHEKYLEIMIVKNLMPVPTPSVLVSWGEVIDKITILEIKLEKIKNDIANQNIKKELQYLNESVHPSVLLVTESLKKDLKHINLQLWQIEDSIRDKEATKEFDETFIELARSVYKVNDARAELKKQINIKLSSDLVEEKSYAKF